MGSRVVFFGVFILFCIALFAPTDARLATAPVLLTKTNSTRALAVESTSLLAEPFWADAGAVQPGQSHPRDALCDEFDSTSR